MQHICSFSLVAGCMSCEVTHSEATKHLKPPYSYLSIKSRGQRQLKNPSQIALSSDWQKCEVSYVGGGAEARTSMSLYSLLVSGPASKAEKEWDI